MKKKNKFVEIRKLLKRYDEVYFDWGWNDMMMGRCEKGSDEYDEHDVLCGLFEYEMMAIAKKLKDLEPSKYMIEKYFIDDIWSEHFIN